MAKSPGNHGKEWSKEDVKNLKDLAKQSTPTKAIAVKLKRSLESVRSKAKETGVSFRPKAKAAKKKK